MPNNVEFGMNYDQSQKKSLAPLETFLLSLSVHLSFFFYLVQCMLSVAVGLLDFFPRLSVLEQKSPPRPEQLCVWLIGVILVVPYAANMSYFFVQKRRELWENEKSKARNTYLCKGAVYIPTPQIAHFY